MKRHFQCAEQVKSPFKLSKYCACHAKRIPSLIRITYEMSFPMRGASKVTLRTSPNTAPATKSWSPRFQRKLPEVLPPIERRFEDNPRIIRPWNCHLAPAASETFPVRSWRRFCIVKYNVSRSGYLPKCHDVLRLPRKVTLQPHQILRLPHKINVISDLRHIWSDISNARSK